jgi:small conductance mechanosensitive channel
VRLGAWRRYTIAFVILLVLTILALQPLWRLTAAERVALRWIFALLWVGMALGAYRGLRIRVGDRMQGQARIASQFGLVIGLVAVVLIVLWLLGVSTSGIAVGGAVTGVVLGLAAQSTLSNFFAGTVLMAVHPYLPGDSVSLRSSYWGIEYRGRVVDMNFFYTILDDGAGRRISIPNAAAAAAAVTHLPDLRVRVPVPLPAGADLTAAQGALARTIPGAALAVNRYEPGTIWVDVALPDPADPAALAPWVRAMEGAGAAGGGGGTGT